MKHCINCGEEIADDAELCTECGVNQSTELTTGNDERSADEKYCTSCGKRISKDAEVCPECGVGQPTPSSESSSDQIAAGVLALLLGGLGGHKFYQGNVKIGLLYLCLFWTFIPAIIGFIEGILMLVADEDEYERKYADGSIFGR